MPLMILLWLQLQVTPTFQLGCLQSIKNWNIAWPAEIQNPSPKLVPILKGLCFQTPTWHPHCLCLHIYALSVLSHVVLYRRFNVISLQKQTTMNTHKSQHEIFVSIESFPKKFKEEETHKDGLPSS